MCGHRSRYVDHWLTCQGGAAAPRIHPWTASIITVDHGPEFEGQVLDARAYEANVTLSFIRPAKPNENAYIESFNGKFPDECLTEHWFVTIAHARRIIETWRIECNTERPHSSLGNLTPEEFAEMILANATDLVSFDLSPDFEGSSKLE